VAALKFENVVFPDSVDFKCRNCGFCCKNNPPDINPKEQQKIEAEGFKNFLDPFAEVGEHNIRRNKNGNCIFLTKENTCKIHSSKPSICQLEPFIISDYDDKTGLIFLKLNPMAAETCKGIFKGELIAPKEIASAAQRIIKDISEIIAEKTGQAVGDKKVRELTRKIILDLNSEQANSN
jgi:Fe-S-cluster containining protein